MSEAERLYTEAEYLAFERASHERHELVNGRIYAMSGAKDAHNHIAGNTFAALHRASRGRPCRVWIADMRVKVNPTGMYTYPDVAALCGEAEFGDDWTDTLLNPSVIVEVLSASTANYDRTDKFAHYRRIATLREYVLVAQDRVYVERHTRGRAGWTGAEFDRLDDAVALPSVDATLALRDVYEGVRFVERPRPRTVREALPPRYAVA